MAHAFPRFYPAFIRYHCARFAPDLRQRQLDMRMASYRKRGNTWRAEVRRNGVSASASFATKGEAVAWAHQVEAAIAAGTYGRAAVGTFGDLATRYAAEVSPTKDGARWEQIRIRALTDGRPEVFPPVPPDPLASVPLAA